MVRTETPLATPDAAKKLGLSASQFRKVARQKNLEPAEWYVNQHYRSGPLCPKWSVKDLGRIARHVDVKRLRAKNEDPGRTAEGIRKNKLAKMERKYESPSSAIPDACEAMFNLNRYAKHDTCSRKNRADIYALKEGLISHLITLEKLDEVGLHMVKGRSKICFACAGSGNGRDDFECERCDGSGIYEHGSMKTFVVFRFLVGEERYCWHSPASQFVEQFKNSPILPNDWQPGDTDKPLELPKSRLSVCKDIVKYATGQLSNGDDAGNGHLPGSPIVSDTGFEIATTKRGNGWMANVASA